MIYFYFLNLFDLKEFQHQHKVMMGSTSPCHMQYNEQTLTLTLTMQHALWGREVFCNWACNLVFESQWPFVTHYIFTPINVIGQVAQVAKDAIHYTYDHTLV
jgi:hypothetical protein